MADQEYQIVPVTPKDSDKVLEHLHRFFCREEPLNIDIQLLGERGEDKCAELDNYCLGTIPEGTTLCLLLLLLLLLFIIIIIIIIVIIIIVIIIIIIDRLVGLVLACLNTDHEVASSIHGTSTNFKVWIRSGTGFTQPREDNWLATLLGSVGSD